MRRLTAFYDYGVAGELCEQFNSAGIRATLTSESCHPWLGQVRFVMWVVWVSEDATPGAVDEMWATFRRQYAQRRGLSPTRVDPSAMDSLRCKMCGYDLRGQVEDGRCPECGHPYYIIKQVRCPGCGAEVPGNFEVCWKCGSAMPGSESASPGAEASGAP